MGVFSSVVFSIEGLGVGRERKANFIFLTINLLFLVLFHFYNYTLHFGTCVKLSLPIEQEVKTSQWKCFRDRKSVV